MRQWCSRASATPPDQIKEATFRLTATNRMNLQRLVLPEVRIQKRCPWQFPSTPRSRPRRLVAAPNGQYSLYYRCGYSAGATGGTGNLNGGAPFTSCGYTRTDCQARGMWTRFGGIEFVPPVISVRGYGKDWTSSDLSVNQAQYNDFVPMVYGTAWYQPLVVFARNDGNLTRMEVLLGIGQMQGVVTVLVNDIQIPLGVSGQNMIGDRLVQRRNARHARRRVRYELHGLERAAGGRPLRQHGVPLGGGAECDQ